MHLKVTLEFLLSRKSAIEPCLSIEGTSGNSSLEMDMVLSS